MSKTAVYYFSGTGNSRHAAGILAAELAAKNIETRIAEITSSTKHPPVPEEINIFIFPVYAFDVPAIALDYIRKMPDGAGAKAAAIAIFGNTSVSNPGHEGAALINARRALERNGYTVFYTEAAGYPANFTQLMNPPEEKQCELIRLKTDETIKSFARDIADGKKHFRPVLPGVYSFVKVFGPLFSILGRRQLGKILIAGPDCTACGVCAENCPAKTITIKNKYPCWGYECQGCQRCINSCPEKTIQTSPIRLAVLLALIFVPYPTIARHIIGVPSIYILWSILIYILGYAAAFAAADKIISLLETFPALRKLFSKSFTNRFRRYLST